jgi:hypothetical protein
VHSELDRLVAASYLITLLRQQSANSSGTHKFIPLRTQSVLYGCGKDSFHLTSIPEYSCKLALGTCGQIYVVTLGAI